jgi:protein-disulfide isomerase
MWQEWHGSAWWRGRSAARLRTPLASGSWRPLRETFPLGLDAMTRMDRFLVLINCLVTALVVVLLFRQGGAGRSYLNEVQQRRAVKGRLAAVWRAIERRPQLSSSQGSSVALVEFSDYQCSYCRGMAFSLDSLATASGLRIAIVHLPLASHPRAEGAARASICAARQGRFPDMHHYLLTTLEWERTGNWVGAAMSVGGIDTALFAACLHDSVTTAHLAEDLALAKALGVSGTPTFVGGNDWLVGVQSPRALLRLAAGSHRATAP